MAVSSIRWHRFAILGALFFILSQGVDGAILDIQPREIPYGHTTTVTVTHDTPVSLVVTGASSQSSLTLSTGSAIRASLILQDRILLLTADAQLVIADTNGKPQHTVNLPAGLNRGLLSWEGLLIAYGSGGIGLLQPDKGSYTLQRQSKAPPLALVRGGLRRLAGITEDHQLVVFERHDNGDLRQTGKLKPPGEIRDIAIDGNFAYLALGDKGIVSYSLLDTKPRLASRFRTTGSANSLVIDNAILYIADGENGLSILDISDPGLLRQLGSHNKLGATQRIRMANMGLLLLNSDQQLLLVDVMDAWQPRLIGSHNLNTGAPVTDVQFSGDLAYVARDNSLYQIDLREPSLPMISSEGVNQGGSRRAWIQDKTLYVADWFSGLHIYDISNPARLRHKGNFHTPGSAKGVLVQHQIAYVGDDDHGLQVIDVSKPAHSRRLTEVATGGLAYTMKRVENLLYVADHRGGFHIIDISKPELARKLSSYDTPGKAWAIDVRNNIAYVADDNAGILSFDVSNPLQPVPLGSFNPKGQAEDIVIRGNIAFAAFFDRGLYLLDISDPNRIKEVSHIFIPGNARGIALEGDTAYVAAWDAGLQILDISYLTDPKIIGQLDTDGSTWGVNIAGHHAYLLDWWGGIKVADIRDPKAPKLISRYHARTPIKQVHIQGKYAYLASGDAGVQVFDIKNPLNPIWVTAADVAGHTRDLYVSDDVLYAVNDRRLDILDISDPFTLKFLRAIDIPAGTQAITGGFRFLALLDAKGTVVVRDLTNPVEPGAPLQLHQNVRAMHLLGDYLVLATERGLAAYPQSDFGAKPVELATALALTRLHGDGDTLIGFQPGSGLHWYHLQEGKLLDGKRSLAFNHPVDQIRLRGDQLLVTAENALYTFNLDKHGQIISHNYYPASQTVTLFDILDNNVFFAGGPTLTSVSLLPATPVQAVDDNTTLITVPATMPMGSYHIRDLLDSAASDTLPVVNVTLMRPKRPRLSGEMFKRMMQPGDGK